jgi:hypothetical protein
MAMCLATVSSVDGIEGLDIQDTTSRVGHMLHRMDVKWMVGLEEFTAPPIPSPAACSSLQKWTTQRPSLDWGMSMTWTFGGMCLVPLAKSSNVNSRVLNRTGQE